MRVICLFAVLLLGGCSNSAEDKFWAWFQDNEERISGFEQDQEDVFNEIHAKLREFHESLVFELSPKRDGEAQEFVISADGNVGGFPQVRALITAAPELDGWKFTAFRPRIGSRFSIRVAGYELNPDAMSYRMKRSGDTASLKVYVSGAKKFEDPDLVRFAAGILMNNALGEEDYTLRISEYTCHPCEDEAPEGCRPFSELASEVDQLKN